jgi:octaprenyl-diphosphate synthase
MTITDVIEQYREDLDRVERQIDAGLDSKAVLVKQMGRHILGGGGKRVRPLLTMVASNLCGNAGPDAVLLAATVEFIHTASLLHDDVVDEADIRRGRETANNMWGNPVTVLVGDFLYSKALSQSVSVGIQKVVEVLSGTTTAMSEGEILQLLKLGDPATTEQEYLEIIERKTAVLMATSCRLAAIIAELGDAKDEALAGYGTDIGLAFQLMDDALDYTAEAEKLGKALGKDLAEGKLTLPLIHLLQNCPGDTASRVTAIIESEELPDSDLEFVLSEMAKTRSIEYTLDRAKGHIENAKGRLDIFPPSPHKDALFSIADFIIEREM